MQLPLFYHPQSRPLSTTKVHCKSLGSEIQSWLTYAGILRSMSAVGWTFCVYKILNLPENQPVLGLVFTLIYIIYNQDYLKNHSQADDQVNMKERSKWIFTHLRQLQILVAAAVVITLFLLTLIPTALPPILIGMSFALVYTVKFLPGRKSPKQLPGIKAFYVASLWTALIVWVPLAVAGMAWTQTAILTAIACFCFVAALVNLWDTRDIAGDKLVGTITLAVLLGARGAKLVSLALALLGGCIAVVIGSIPLFSVSIYIVVLIMNHRPEAEKILCWFNPVGIFAGLVTLCI